MSHLWSSPYVHLVLIAQPGDSPRWGRNASDESSTQQSPYSAPVQMAGALFYTLRVRDTLLLQSK